MDHDPSIFPDITDAEIPEILRKMSDYRHLNATDVNAIRIAIDLIYRLFAIDRHVDMMIKQHRDNIELWDTGFLLPTEPEEDERRITMAELKAAIDTLEQIKKQTGE